MSNKLIKPKPEKKQKFTDLNRKQLAAVLLLFMPVFSFFMFETIAGNFRTIMENTMGIILINLCIWYFLYIVVFALTNHTKHTILILNPIIYIFAVLNAFVVQFREQPIMVMDIKSFWTAASVAGEYTYSFTPTMIWLGVLNIIILCIICVLKLDFSFVNWKIRLGYIGIALVCIVFSFHGMLSGNWFEKAGASELDFFRFNFTYQTDGYMACTVKSIRYLQVDEPEGYSVEKVQMIADKLKQEEKKQQDLPENVIVIMNESFSDLSVLGEFQTTEPVLSNFNSMTGNIKRGNLYVSVFGGSTANSEFEFLTGNSIAYMPTGTVAYQMYVEPGDSSLVDVFNANDYRTIAFHPYRKNNYNREKVYGIYGFDEFYGIDDVEVENIRKYASDKSDYQNLIKMYEEKTPGEKLFIYNITMQNHSGYKYKEYKNTVSLENCPGKFPQAEQYLSLMKESDSAWKYLTDYFSQVDEKTVILLFGDHQPKLEDAFYEMVMGAETAENSFEHLQKKHITPYMLWANYELNIEEEANISTNYLGSYLLKAIGMELPIYNQYLLDLQEQIPACNLYGILDNAENLYWIGNVGEYTNVLNEYHIFQYNNLFDNRNRIDELYE